MAKRWPDAQEADETLQRGEAAKIVEAQCLYGALGRITPHPTRCVARASKFQEQFNARMPIGSA